MESYNNPHSHSKGKGWYESRVYMPSVNRKVAPRHRKVALKSSGDHSHYNSATSAQIHKKKDNSKRTQLIDRSSQTTNTEQGTKNNIVRREDLAGMPPMVGRVGGKTKLKKTLRSHVPDHDVYVEPFMGGGTLFWDKALVRKNVINDKDPALAKFYKDIKTGPTSEIKSCRLPTTKKDFESAKNKLRPDGTYEDPCDYLSVVKRSYGCNGRSFNMPYQESRPNVKKSPETARINKIVANADMYQEKLSKTKIYNRDFSDVMEKYDSKDTFHYLDPPYWETHHDYYLPKVYPEDVASSASKMKGKVLVSYDDSPAVKKAFKGWKTEKHDTKYEMQSSNKKARGEKKNATEVLMMNYNPKTGKRIKVPRVAG